jgi:hypothetical protein
MIPRCQSGDGTKKEESCSVLRADKDETSVDIMGGKLC